MALPGIRPWTDQDLVLYHGTTATDALDVLAGIDVAIGGYLKDFGRGFYTTTRRDKANSWAQSKALQRGDSPAVIEFIVPRNRLAMLDCLFFVRGDVNANDYWSFVQYCRTTAGDHFRADRLWYDIVVGPVTGTWKRQTVIADTDQVSFHTSGSALLLDESLKARIL